MHLLQSFYKIDRHVVHFYIYKYLSYFRLLDSSSDYYAVEVGRHRAGLTWAPAVRVIRKFIIHPDYNKKKTTLHNIALGEVCITLHTINIHTSTISRKCQYEKKLISPYLKQLKSYKRGIDGNNWRSNNYHKIIWLTRQLDAHNHFSSQIDVFYHQRLKYGCLLSRHPVL